VDSRESPLFCSQKHETRNRHVLAGILLNLKKFKERLNLTMEAFSAKDKQIFDDMKQCVKDLGLKILDEKREDDIISGLSMFEYGNYNMGIVFSYDTVNNLAQVFMRYADMPAEKLLVLALYELLNHINASSLSTIFILMPVQEFSHCGRA